MSWTSIKKCDLRYGHAQRGFYGHAQRAQRGELKADDNSEQLITSASAKLPRKSQNSVNI